MTAGGAGSGGTGDAVGDQLYRETPKSRHLKSRTATIPCTTRSPSTAAWGLTTYCMVECTATQCTPAAADVESPGPPVAIGGVIQPGNVPIFGLADDERGPAIYDPSKPDPKGIFDDPHFARLNAHYIRAIVPYDLVKDTKRQDAFNATSRYTDFFNWEKAAEASNMRSWVSFPQTPTSTRARSGSRLGVSTNAHVATPR